MRGIDLNKSLVQPANNDDDDSFKFRAQKVATRANWIFTQTKR